MYVLFSRLYKIMPYIIVRGTLGMANTKIYGLCDHEINEIKSRLRFMSMNEYKDEITVNNSVVYVLNQLEYFFGYRVVTCTCQGDMVQPMWTLSRPPGGYR